MWIQAIPSKVASHPRDLKPLQLRLSYLHRLAQRVQFRTSGTDEIATMFAGDKPSGLTVPRILAKLSSNLSSMCMGWCHSPQYTGKGGRSRQVIPLIFSSTCRAVSGVGANTSFGLHGFPSPPALRRQYRRYPSEYRYRGTTDRY
jgi:hypothetical protein